MKTYRFRIHVEGIGVLEEVMASYTPADAQRAIEAKYSPRRVIVYTVVQVA